MTYLVQNARPEDFGKVQIRHQMEIVQSMGTPLVPEKALAAIKEKTKGFKEQDEKALEADRLLADLLKREGIILAPPEPVPEKTEQAAAPSQPKTKSEGKHNAGSSVSDEEMSRMRRERERARALRLLELELSLANQQQ